VYLIQHLDTDKKYVGITSADLKTRWDQHRNDPNSAVYEALRADGHRMTMYELSRFTDRKEALDYEQICIHELTTYHPHGWNRMARKVPDPKWKWYYTAPSFEDESWMCPTCGEYHTHQGKVQVFNRCGEDAEHGLNITIEGRVYDVKSTMDGNPSSRRQGLIIEFQCENCHDDILDGYEEDYEFQSSDIPFVERKILYEYRKRVARPYHRYMIYQHKGTTYHRVEFCLEDNHEL
jgi:hypothetical protein